MKAFWCCAASLCSKFLGKVPRPVGVVAKRNSGVESQSLKWHNAEERRQTLTGFRHVVDPAFITSAELSEEAARFRVLAVRNDNSEEVYLTSGNLAHDGDRLALLLQVGVQNDEYCWHAGVDLGVGVEVVGHV